MVTMCLNNLLGIRIYGQDEEPLFIMAYEVGIFKVPV